MSKRKKIVSIVFSILIFIIAWLAFCGYQWSWGPFVKLHDYKTTSLAGNAEQYALDTIEVERNSPLKNKNILFLGSSVTYGASSMGVSFADYIGAMNDCNIIKEAVSGTTLVDEGADSIHPTQAGYLEWWTPVFENKLKEVIKNESN